MGYDHQFHILSDQDNRLLIYSLVIFI